MKNIILLSSLLAVIAGIASCTEKEDPIQTVKDRLVGTWVTRDYQRGTRWLYDSLVLRQDNSLYSVLNSGESTFGFTSKGDTLVVFNNQYQAPRRYRIEFPQNNAMIIYNYGSSFWDNSLNDLYFIKR